MAVDVLIVGGGLTGALLSIALSNTKYKTVLVDIHPFDIKTSSDFDARSIALSSASVQILKMLGIWDGLSKDVAPINHIHVSEQKRLGVTNLKPASAMPLGYVAEAQSIFQSLKSLISPDNILAPAQLIALDQKKKVARIQTGTDKEIVVKAELIVAADGADSMLRKLVGLNAIYKSYHQKALVANIGLSRDHEGVAFERFTQSGPLALLPMTKKRSALVWSLSPERADELHAMPEDEFLKYLHQAFGYRLGRLSRLGKRSVFPLQQVIMKQQSAWPVVFIGNAAHTLHPVAGQGFNLGLRDVALLAQNLVQGGLCEKSIQLYQSQRRHDQRAITFLTNGLVESFSVKLPGLSILRGVGLLAFDNLHPLKNMLTRYASGYGGVIPDLVCQIPIEQGAF